MLKIVLMRTDGGAEITKTVDEVKYFEGAGGFTIDTREAGMRVTREFLPLDEYLMVSITPCGGGETG